MHLGDPEMDRRSCGAATTGSTIGISSQSRGFREELQEGKKQTQNCPGLLHKGGPARGLQCKTENQYLHAARKCSR